MDDQIMNWVWIKALEFEVLGAPGQGGSLLIDNDGCCAMEFGSHNRRRLHCLGDPKFHWDEGKGQLKGKESRTI